MASSAFLEALPAELLASMQDMGMTLHPHTRPVLSARGQLAVRLVWRNRANGLSAVVTWTLRGGMSDALLDAIDLAMAPAAPRARPPGMAAHG